MKNTNLHNTNITAIVIKSIKITFRTFSVVFECPISTQSRSASNNELEIVLNTVCDALDKVGQVKYFFNS